MATLKKRAISRRGADGLFRDVIATVNETPLVSWIGYGAVRLGWQFGVRFAGQRWNKSRSCRRELRP